MKGAFTGATGAQSGLFAAADGGTLFLDEIAELPMAMQVKLLRALQERKVKPVGGTEEKAVDVRVVAATNRDLEVEVAQGGFRQDLYYRLNVLALHLPPLRERPQDVGPLARGMAARFSRKFNKTLFDISPGALAALEASLKQQGKTLDDKGDDGWTYRQRFFLSFAQVWCQNQGARSARQSAAASPQSPGRGRVNGAVQNFDEFGKAFGCSKGTPMYPVNSCRVW